MKRKAYITPQTKVMVIFTKEDNMLENWSAPDATGGGNHPEGKENDFLYDDDFEFVEEQEKKEAFGLPEKFTSVWDM